MKKPETGMRLAWGEVAEFSKPRVRRAPSLLLVYTVLAAIGLLVGLAIGYDLGLSYAAA